MTSNNFTVPEELDCRQSVWADQRLMQIHHNGYAYEVSMPESIEEHQQRKREIRRRIRLSAGLLPEFPLPDNPPSIGNRHVYKGVAIYDVSVQTLPGLRLTGNLFLPETVTEPLPGILCPHGHWTKGRVDQNERGGVVMRCFQLARFGFAVFAYDMLGYNDNNDLPHRFSADLRKKGDFCGITPFGLQTVNSLRALNMMAFLPEVDPERIGCTGASGGGSQTWFLGLLDDRVKVLAPVCMLSSHFQGGCTCEEGPLLRTSGVTSFDIVSCLAPRPLLLPSVNGDWTDHVPDYEYPRMKEIYRLYGAGDRVENFHYADEHNYNKRTRQHVYSFFLRYLAGKDVPMIVEEENLPHPGPELLWHGGKQPSPASEETIQKSFAKLKRVYASPTSLPVEERRRLLSEILSDGPAAKNVVERVGYIKWPVPGGVAFQRVISRRGAGDRIDAIRIVPGHEMEMLGSGNAVGKVGYLMIAPDSFRSVSQDPVLSRLAAELTEQGIPGMIAELLGSGESAGDLKRSPRDFNSPIDLAFNPSLYSMRVQDIRTLWTLLRERGWDKIVILSTPETVPAALAAAALLPEADAVLDLENVNDRVWYRLLNLQPLMGRIGGIRGLIRLSSRPGVIFVHGEPYKAEIAAGKGILWSGDFDNAVKVCCSPAKKG